jgi:hypothetical protein
MRKLTAALFVVFLTTSAFAAPNDSSERTQPSPVARIISKIKIIIRALEDGHVGPPIPSAPTPNP